MPLTFPKRMVRHDFGAANPGKRGLERGHTRKMIGPVVQHWNDRQPKTNRSSSIVKPAQVGDDQVVGNAGDFQVFHRIGFLHIVEK